VESPGEESHSAVEVPANVRGSRVPADKEIGVFFFFFFYFFFFFLYHIFVVKVQEIAWSASYGENKTQNPKRTNKRNIRHQNSSTGVRTGPRPTYGREITASMTKETLP